MSWMIVGTVPYEGFPLLDVKCSMENGRLHLGNETVPIARGTPALLAAACIASQLLSCELPKALLAGDIGRGTGSKMVYDRLVKTMPHRDDGLLVFHYLQPDLDWHNRILLTLEEKSDSRVLIADAGYMYVAKMSGFASSYHLFTPDVGELAFLADESAPHPFFTRGFILKENDRVPELISRAYEYENAARFLLVKGERDFVASSDGIIEEISEPCIEAMEPIGGTGDTLTGLVSALVASGKSIPESALLAAKTNRFLGLLSNPTPASSIGDLLPALPEAMNVVLGTCKVLSNKQV